MADSMKLTKPQMAALRYMDREDYVATPLGSPSVTHRILAERGLCTISEVHGRAGFYASRITDAGRVAIAPTDIEILTDTVPVDLLAGEIDALAASPPAREEAPAEGAGEIEDLKAANKDHCRAVNTLTLEAVEFERQIADLRASVAKANSGFEEYERKFYLASDDVDRLKLAICGGEDAPGAINAVSVEDCERFIAEERGRHIDTEARISAAGVGFDGGSLTLGALERARSEYDIGFQDGCAEEFRKAQPEYDFKAEDEWFEHVLSRPDDYEGPDAGMHDTEIVENEDV